MRRASTSLRGALTEAQPRYVSWLNTTLSSSGMGLMGLLSDEDSSAAKTSKGSTKKCATYFLDFFCINFRVTIL